MGGVSKRNDLALSVNLYVRSSPKTTMPLLYTVSKQDEARRPPMPGFGTRTYKRDLSDQPSICQEEQVTAWPQDGQTSSPALLPGGVQRKPCPNHTTSFLKN